MHICDLIIKEILKKLKKKVEYILNKINNLFCYAINIKIFAIISLYIIINYYILIQHIIIS